MWRLTAPVLVVVTAIGWCNFTVHAGLREDSPARDREILERVMAADLAGDALGRSAILNEALRRSPASAALRWQAGQIRGADGTWRTIEQSCARQETNPDLTEYRSKRSRSGGTLAEQVELARWCLQTDLPLQERFHWLAVLELDPNNELARKRLKVGNYQGQMLSHQEAAEFKSRNRTRQRNMESWRPRVKRWLKDLESNDSYRRMAAKEALRSVGDPAAIPALVDVFRVSRDWQPEHQIARQQRHSNAERVARRTAAALVETMGSIPQHDATLVLVDLAVSAPWYAVRQAATNQLKERRLTDFVPMLISNLHYVDASSYGPRTLLPGGSSGGQLYVETFDATYSVNYHRLASPQVIGDSGITIESSRRGEAEVRRLESMSRQWSARAEKLNPRIQTVLAQVGGQQYTDNPRECWEAWRSYNELSLPTDKPHYSYSATATVARFAPRSTECFVAGTPVWTLTGPQAIETIMAGDQVLAQDPTTGELAYKSVLDTTYREPRPTVRIELEHETIVATRGHRFWESGYGWRMAKFLEPGVRLASTAGSRRIQQVELGEEEAAFNLLVEGFHTYFVGQSRVLVHDNGCPRPTLAIVPGWQPRTRPSRPLSFVKAEN